MWHRACISTSQRTLSFNTFLGYKQPEWGHCSERSKHGGWTFDTWGCGWNIYLRVLPSLFNNEGMIFNILILCCLHFRSDFWSYHSRHRMGAELDKDLHRNQPEGFHHRVILPVSILHWAVHQPGRLPGPLAGGGGGAALSARLQLRGPLQEPNLEDLVLKTTF